MFDQVLSARAVDPARAVSSVRAVDSARAASGDPTAPGPVGVRIGVRVLGSDALSREGVMRVLADCPEVRLVVDPASATVDVVVVAVDGAGDATLRLLQSIRNSGCPRVVLVCADLGPEAAAAVVETGVVGIVRRRDVTRAGLRHLVRSVATGEAVLPPDLLAGMLGRGSRQPGTSSTVPTLGDREVKVLRLLSDGSDTREIAARLCYSERTVKTIIQDITHRFGLRNRSHAVAYALRQGMI